MKRKATPLAFRLTKEDLAIVDKARERYSLPNRADALRWVLRWWVEKGSQKRASPDATGDAVLVEETVKTAYVDTPRGRLRAHPCVVHVDCSLCGQPAGKACIGAHGVPRADTHAVRREAYTKWKKEQKRAS